MKTFEEWWEYFRAKYPTATEKCCASMAWAARDEEVAALQAKEADARKSVVLLCAELKKLESRGIGERIGL